MAATSTATATAGVTATTTASAPNREFVSTYMDYDPYASDKDINSRKDPEGKSPDSIDGRNKKGTERPQAANGRHRKPLSNHHRKPQRIGLFHSSWALAALSATDLSRRSGGRGRQPSGMNECRQERRDPQAPFIDGCHLSAWCTRQLHPGFRKISHWVAPPSKRGLSMAALYYLCTGQPGAGEAEEISKQRGGQQN